MAEARPREIRNYLAADGREPFLEWLNALRDANVQGRIRVRINRVQQGNLGDSRSVGEGVFELRFDFGPGYRVYFGEDGNQVILLAGGMKGTQSADIKTAHRRWEDYNA